MEKTERLYINKDGKRLRCGFTTGSCAAASAKAALMMLITGEDVRNVQITTPGGVAYVAEIVDISRDKYKGTVTCAVVKDSGDDPDVTNGMKIYTTVSLDESNEVIIDGGKGIGRVTKPGLDQPIGEAAINSGPRKMIKDSLCDVLDEYGRAGEGVRVIVSAPEGEEIAEKTFNPKLGITGGISILGSTGIVEPMSDAAVIETVRSMMRMRRAEGKSIVLAAPGNYGLAFLKDRYGIDEDTAVMTSNFIYDSVKIAAEEGFDKMVFAGHMGKMIKVAGGIKNTHSSYGDHRMEIISEITALYADAADREKLCAQIEDCVMTDEAIRIISEAGLLASVSEEIVRRIKMHMDEWADNKTDISVIVFHGNNTMLAHTKGADEMLAEIKREY